MPLKFSSEGRPASHSRREVPAQSGYMFLLLRSLETESPESEAFDLTDLSPVVALSVITHGVHHGDVPAHQEWAADIEAELATDGYDLARLDSSPCCSF